MPATEDVHALANLDGRVENSSEARHQEALFKIGALQNAILNSANFSIIATGEKGIIQLFNVGAEEVVNQISPSDMHDPREVMARAQALSLELDTPIAPGFEALSFKASRGIEDVYELTKIRKDGSRFPAIVSITALRDDYGEIIGYLLIGTDNTVRKQVESELHVALDAAEKANRAKTDFLSGMSHELRTPLNAILGFAQLMESGLPHPTPLQQRSLDQILKAGWYLLELINEILDLALIESGKVTLSREPVSLAEVMQECRAMIEPQAQKRGIGLVVTKRLVELMGGSIGVDSAVGVGSVFWFELSLTAAPTLAAHEAEHAALARLPGDTPLRTLLYVEDNPANLELVEQIIALSANALTRDIEKALTAGFFNYLTKPIKVDAFLDALDVALKYAQTARATHKEHP